MRGLVVPGGPRVTSLLGGWTERRRVSIGPQANIWAHAPRGVGRPPGGRVSRTPLSVESLVGARDERARDRGCVVGSSPHPSNAAGGTPSALQAAAAW